MYNTFSMINLNIPNAFQTREQYFDVLVVIQSEQYQLLENTKTILREINKTHHYKTNIFLAFL